MMHLRSFSRGTVAATTILALPLLFVGSGARAETRLVPAQYTTIQAAIDAAVPSDTIQVAAGTYRESLSWTGKDLTIVGAGQGSTIVDPSVASNGPGGRCLTTSGLTAASRIDGFTFRNGSTDGYGGGMENFDSNLTVANCTFSGNVASLDGGGMANRYAGPTVVNCTFNGNASNSYGGGMFNLSRNLSITNCAFNGNSAVYGGGGMYNGGANASITNCTIGGNAVVYDGGGMYNAFCSPSMVNCILWGNAARSAGAIYEGDSRTTVTDSIVQGLANSTPDASGNFAADPRFQDAAGGDLRLQPGSPAIDAGSDAAVTTAFDLDGNARIQGAAVDLGAYEFKINRPPTADAQTVVLNEDTSRAITLTGSDPEGGPLTYALAASPAHGTLTGTAPNLIYTPAANFNGTDSLTFTVTDGAGASSAVATVQITVVAVNDAPTAASDAATTKKNTAVIINVLANDRDVEGDALRVTAVTQPASGSVVPNTNGTVTFTPKKGFTGTTTFTYTISDGHGGTATATVTVTVTAK